MDDKLQLSDNLSAWLSQEDIFIIRNFVSGDYSYTSPDIVTEWTIDMLETVSTLVPDITIRTSLINLIANAYQEYIKKLPSES